MLPDPIPFVSNFKYIQNSVSFPQLLCLYIIQQQNCIPMHSSFKSKPIPYSQIQNSCQHLLNIGHDDNLIPDEHSSHPPYANSLEGAKITGLIEQQRVTNKKKPNVFHSSDTTSSNGKNSNNLSSKKLTHGLTSYKDIKSSYCTSQAAESKQSQITKSRSGSKKKKSEVKLSDEVLNKITSDEIQCTFTPKTNGGQPYKNFKDFVNFQENFLAKKFDKIQKIKKQMIERQSSQVTFVPKIDKRSRKISETSSDYQMNSQGSLKKLEKAPIYERLYKIPRVKENGWECATFTPKILNKSKSLVRNDKVENLLYSDAVRRIEQQKMVEKESNIPKYPPSGFSSSKRQKHNNKLLCKKIRSQFLQFIQTDDGAMKVVSPILAVTVISQIFNVELNPNRNQQLCWLIVSLLIGDENASSNGSSGQVQTKRLWDFIKFIVVGLDGFQKGVSSFTQEEALKIHRELGYFYSMRLSKWPNKTEEAQDSEKEYRIETSAKTNKMAEAHRARKLEQVTQFISETNICEANSLLRSKTPDNQGTQTEQKLIRLQDLFILDEIRKKTQWEEKRIKKQEQEMKKCTFKPALNDNSLRTAKEKIRENRQKPNVITEIVQNNKSLKKVSENLQTQKTKKIVIKPKINENRPSFDCQNKMPKKENDPLRTCRDIKNVEKTLLRLNLARKVKDVEMVHKGRGYNCDSTTNWLRQVQGQKKQILEEVSTFLGYKTNFNQKQMVSEKQLSQVYQNSQPK